MDRRRWHRIAADVGVLIAPAGLNFLVPSTTFWLYTGPVGASLPGLGAAGFTFRSTDVHIAMNTDDLQRNLAALRIVDALWNRRLARIVGFTPRVSSTKLLRARVDALALPQRDIDMRRLLLRSCAVLEGLRLVPEYHPRGAKSVGYLFDLIENGLTFLLVERAPRDT